MKRSSGILMHISSLPSPHGIGTLGRAAYGFADFLAKAGQQYWQMLPLGHTGYGDSPYQAFSMYAGNPYFIDLDMLIADDLLTCEEVNAINWGKSARRVDYGAIYAHRYHLLRAAYRRGFLRHAAEMEAFQSANSCWLQDYALFMALKQYFGMRSWMQWEDDAIRRRQPEAIQRYTCLLEEDIRFYMFVQYLFFRQWAGFKEYVSLRGIRLIGDLPIYAAPDSAEVWSRPECFLLDEERNLTAVAGVPPDYFSADGQLWGNPLYDWESLKKNGYALWMDRIAMAARMFDVIRIDHFRGLASYWSVPSGETTARNGKWVQGPGWDLIEAMKQRFGELTIIAEDLGYLTDEVMELVKRSGYPGMKVLQFAFDTREPGNYLPHTYTRHCVCYTGTHDNTTAAGWLREISRDDAAHAEAYLGLNDAEGRVWGLIRGGMASVADLFVAQMQDYLELGSGCRMNTPGTVGGNWQWRMLPGECSDALAEKIACLTRLYGRS